MSNMNLELQLKLQDRMSAGMKAALQAMQRETKNTKKEFDGLNKAANSIKPTGIERMIKSMNTLKSTAKSTFDVLNKAAQAGAAIGAGAYVVKRALDKPMAYGDKLAEVANVAYSDRGATGRIAGQAALNKGVRDAQAAANGRGNQEELAAALGNLIGSGAMGKGEAGVKSSMDLLPTLNKMQIGTSADMADLVKLVTSAKQTMGMSDAEIKTFLNNTITGGNLGGAEIKDMARSLPEQMAKYSALGGKGIEGAQALIGYNQASKITAGTAEAGGINLTNLLNKANSKDTQNDFKKLGIDLTGSLVKGRGQGMQTLDVFAKLVDSVANKDPEYKKLKAQAATQKGPEQQATLEAMQSILQQRGMGNVVQDSQAMSALLAILQQQEKILEVREAIKNDKGTNIDTNFKVRDSTAFASKDRSASAIDRSAYAAEQAGDGVITGVLNGIANLSDAFPKTSAAAYALIVALGAAAATSGVGSLFKIAGAAVPLTTALAGIATAALPLITTLALLAAAVGTIAFLVGKWNESDDAEKQRHKGMHKEGGARTVRWVKDVDNLLKKETNKSVIHTHVHLEGKQIAHVINGQNGKTALRH